MCIKEKFSFAKFFGLNSEQSEAVDVEKNISLSAGAGSGKTRVLTSRFLTLLDSGTSIDEIVAITFTEKAALEMKSRIRGGILDKIAIEDKQSRPLWQQQLDNLNRANITTIHSFAATIVRENAAFLGIDFNFAIINQIQKSVFLKDKLNEIINTMFSDENYIKEVNSLYNFFEKKYVDEQLCIDILKLREDIAESSENIHEILEGAKEDKLTSFILIMVKELDDSYYQYKLSKDMFDFGDLQKKAFEILESKLMCDNYKDRYKNFLVDEFQDTNELQRKILYKLTADENGKLIPKKLFVVGDFKQAIYGFRGTDSTIFKRVSEDMGESGLKSLNICYRSEPEIIKGINEIFQYLIEDYQPLKHKDEDDNQNKVELETAIGTIKVNKIEKRISIVTYSDEKSGDTDLIKKAKAIIKDKREIEEFKAVLNEIKESFGVVTEKPSSGAETVIKSIKLLRDKGINFKDICILVRSRGIVPDIEEQICKYKIPYCIIGGTGFFDKSETKNILNLYELAVKGFNEKQTDKQLIKLLSVLKSPLFELPDDVLLKVRQTQLELVEVSFVDAMITAVQELSDDYQKSSLIKSYEYLKELEATAKKMSVVRILESIIEGRGIKEIYLAKKNGPQKLRNIEKLLKLAEQYDNEEFFSSEEFIEYIEFLNENNNNEAEAALDTEDSEAVKIMTIHASKGLEFEAVIVPSIERNVISLSKNQNNKVGFIHYKDTILSRYNMNGEQCSEFIDVLNEKLTNEIHEEIRILYVAMTRAKQYIVLTGKEEEYDGNFKLSEENLVENLNTYEKMIKYATLADRANLDTIAFMSSEDLVQIKVQEHNIVEEALLDDKDIRNRILFKPQIKPRNYASASKYMSYSNCPRKYYYENILGGRYADYTKILEMKLQEKTVDIASGIKATDKGVIVHKVLEHMNKQGSENYETYIEDILDKTYLEEAEKLIQDDDPKEDVDIKKSYRDEVEALQNEIKTFANNYLEMEEKQNSECAYGELIKSSSEVSYLLAPLEDKKMMINGFIDRLKLYKKGDKRIAVIIDYKTNKISGEYNAKHFKEVYSDQLMIYGKAVKELLQVDEINLKLYLLQTGEVVSIEYDESKVTKLMKTMDGSFYKMNTAVSLEDYMKAESEQCSWCKYRNGCL
ncbi:UvrD-helicase domain-containing protein [Clostridium bowmanii]|uniref:UvrD-helicase domain-containing protein n=1 Tax=Clostridium bowmanii TaxID=132925 RepID=UPI001C0D525F|nr:UvrD-helicase domain-containing protein [Clostridium bowmanii]MBU3189949.1 UvrD-helicase domain-containing protein [Clostridium bowmanii]MCA1074617.1 UvrD-helicase domain-containing protein [Clostridium bowmanii]